MLVVVAANLPQIKLLHLRTGLWRTEDRKKEDSAWDWRHSDVATIRDIYLCRRVLEIDRANNFKRHGKKKV